MSIRSLLSAFLAGLALAACRDREAQSTPVTHLPEEEVSCGSAAVREVAMSLGSRMKQVSLLAPDSILVPEIQKAYGSLITPGLLRGWMADPSSAPGRLTSSPWPERLEIHSSESDEVGGCILRGDVIMVTSASGEGEESRQPVTLRMVPADTGWLVSEYNAESYRTGADTLVSWDAREAVDVVRRYYSAINDRDFHQAYGLWSDSGAASGQTFESFQSGFSQTARVEVETGTPGRVEPAAGSRYVKVPVMVRAEAQTGELQRFEGTYTLRRSVVDGATAEQRLWRLYSADIDLVR